MGSEERGFTDRLDERPSLDARKALQARPRDLLIRFAAGALASITSGAVSLALHARAGGTLLAFPAILAASLTLIEEQEDSANAREDARGAVVGGIALVLFAIAATLTLDRLPGAIALLIAALVWAVVSLSLYAALWRPRPHDAAAQAEAERKDD